MSLKKKINVAFSYYNGAIVLEISETLLQGN